MWQTSDTHTVMILTLGILIIEGCSHGAPSGNNLHILSMKATESRNPDRVAIEFTLNDRDLTGDRASVVDHLKHLKLQKGDRVRVELPTEKRYAELLIRPSTGILQEWINKGAVIQWVANGKETDFHLLTWRAGPKPEDVSFFILDGRIVGYDLLKKLPANPDTRIIIVFPEAESLYGPPMETPEDVKDLWRLWRSKGIKVDSVCYFQT